MLINIAGGSSDQGTGELKHKRPSGAISKVSCKKTENSVQYVEFDRVNTVHYAIVKMQENL